MLIEGTMVDLQQMQNDYLKRLGALRAKHGVLNVDKNGRALGVSSNTAYQYERDFNDLFGAEYERRVDALYAEKEQQLGRALDRDTKLKLSDLAKQSFGYASNASGPVDDRGMLDIWLGSSPFTVGSGGAKSAGDFFGRFLTWGTDPAYGDVGGAQQGATDVSDEIKKTSNALSLMLAAGIVYMVVKKL